MTDLKPCPFCGSTNITAVEYIMGFWKHFCHECETEGPAGKTKDESLGRWNTRHGEKVYRVRGMRWHVEPFHTPTEEIGNMVVSGGYQIWQSGWSQKWWWRNSSDAAQPCNSLDHGKQLADAHRRERLMQELEEVEG
jgi:Lar family restriction alleviation protein